MRLRQLAFGLSLIGASTLGLVGCGGGSNKFPESGEVEVSGQVVKGFLNAANVVINSHISGFLTNTTTDQSGLYNLLIPRVDTTITVNVTPTPTTTMICDAPTGCAGGTALGETLTAADLGDFSLKTISSVTQDSTETEVDINVLTTIAATVLENVLTREGRSIANVSASDLAVRQRNASRNTLKVLGLTDNAINQLGSDFNIFNVKLTDATSDDVANLDDTAKLMTAVNAGVAAISTGNNTLAEAVSAMVSVATQVAAGTGDAATLSTQLAALLATVNTNVTNLTTTQPNFNITDIDTTIITDTADLQDAINDALNDITDNLQPVDDSGGTGGTGGSSI